MSSIMDLAKTEAMLFKYGSGAGVNLSPIRGSKEKMSGGGIASGPVSFMKGFDAFAGVVKSGGKTRRAAKMVILDADHPDVIEFIDSKVNEEKKAWALIEAGYDASFTGEAYGSVFFQNANHSVRVTDDFMHAVEADADWTTHEVTTEEVVDTLPGTDRVPQDGGGRLAVRRPGHPVRHDHQRLAHERGQRPHLRQQPVLGIHVPERHGLQPRLHEPHEVRGRGRRVRCRGIPIRQPGDHHGAGDPGRQRLLPDAPDRGELAPVPAAGHRLRQPGRAAHEPGPGLRLRCGARVRGHPDRDHDRRGISPVGGHRARPRRPVQRLRPQRVSRSCGSSASTATRPMPCPTTAHRSRSSMRRD